MRSALLPTCFVFALIGCDALQGEGDSDDIEISHAVLKDMAQRAEAVYENPDHELGENDELAYSVAQGEDGTTIIAIRGTANQENIVAEISADVDLDDTLTIPLHSGFKESAHTLYADIREKNTLGEKVVVTGHSFGGAIAQIIALWLDHDGVDVETYTFGAPKVTLYRKAIHHVRVVHPADPIPRLPPTPFVHFGARVSPMDLSRDTEDADWSDTDVLQHRIGHYRDHLASAMAPAAATTAPDDTAPEGPPTEVRDAVPEHEER